MLMKKIYASILASLLCTAAIAQEHTLSFVQNGQALADGATITLSEVEYIDLGDCFIIEMDPKISARNNTNAKVNATMDCDAIGEGYDDIQFCFGNCYSWGASTHLTSTVELKANEDYLAQVHVGGIFVDEKNYSINAGVKLSLYPATAPEDVVTLNLVFDTTGAGLKELNQAKTIEVYNLCGKKIATSTAGLSKGIYIIKQGGTSRKITIR